MDGYIILSLVEGLVIMCMLGWEIFWLRRMYQVLNQMPTQDQLSEMIIFLKSSVDQMKKVTDPVGVLLSNFGIGFLKGKDQ